MTGVGPVNYYFEWHSGFPLRNYTIASSLIFEGVKSHLWHFQDPVAGRSFMAELDAQQRAVDVQPLLTAVLPAAPGPEAAPPAIQTIPTPSEPPPAAAPHP